MLTSEEIVVIKQLQWSFDDRTYLQDLEMALTIFHRNGIHRLDIIQRLNEIARRVAWRDLPGGRLPLYASHYQRKALAEVFSS